MADLGDFMGQVLDSVKDCAGKTKDAGEGLASFFHNLDGFIRKV